MITAMVLALLASQSEPTMGRVQLMRSLHAIAYVSPNICAGSDKIAIQIWNVSGDNRTNVPAADFGKLEVTVIGIMGGGEVRADPTLTLEGNLDHDVDSIRCVSSPSRVAGASAFVVSLEGGSYRLVD